MIATLALLVATLLIGPWNVLRRTANPVSSDLRRDIGIWAGMLGILHAGVGQFVHLRGRPWLYYVLKDKDGNHFFTDDSRAFERQRQESEKAGLL